MTKKVMFCPCGRVLVTSLNARYDHKVEGYCNQDCKNAQDQKKARGPKQRKKYGVAGSAYDFYKLGDIFKKRVKDG